MTKISEEEVERLASLASIELNDEQKKRLQGELGEIVSYIEQLGELKTDGVEPTFQVTDLSHVTRPDEIIDYGLEREQLLANAPAQQNGHIEVPKVL